jgi:hypothetical protein
MPFDTTAALSIHNNHYLTLMQYSLGNKKWMHTHVSKNPGSIYKNHLAELNTE